VSPPHRATPAGRAYLDLQSRAKKDGRTTQEYLQLYCLEGFLARLVASGHTEQLVLKGGVLLAAYALRRPTADVDLAARNQSNGTEEVRRLVADIAASPLTGADLSADQQLVADDVLPPQSGQLGPPGTGGRRDAESQRRRLVGSPG
jgi:hypothetical protein